jgi:peroxiredoxin
MSKSQIGLQPAFLSRVGTLVVSPRRALADIQSRGRGGVADALVMVLLAVLVGRLAAMVRAVWMVREASLGGTLAQLLSIVGQDLGPALMIVLPAGVAITLLAGRGRRNPGLDIELGAACGIPYFMLSGLTELARSPALHSVAAGLPGSIIHLVGLAWGLVLLVLSVRLVLRRPAGEKPAGSPEPEPIEPPRRSRVAGTVVGGILAGALAWNGVWLSHNPDAVAPVGRGIVAPAFELPRIDGTSGSVSLHQLRGKVVLLDFWARWCPPCLALMHTLHEIYAARRSPDVEFLAISSEGSMADKRDIQEFMNQYPMPYPSLFDDREVGGLYQVVSLPHLVIIGRDGVIRRVMVGQRRKAEIEAEIQQALDR